MGILHCTSPQDVVRETFLFFFSSNLLCSPFFSLSLLGVTQIRGHKAGSSPPSPLRFDPCIFIAKIVNLFLPSSTRVARAIYPPNKPTQQAYEQRIHTTWYLYAYNKQRNLLMCWACVVHRFPFISFLFFFLCGSIFERSKSKPMLHNVGWRTE